MALNLETRTRRRTAPAPVVLDCDLCVVGSGAAGISAALEGARLGRRVVLVDAQPSLGGQAVNGIIGTFCGLFSNGPRPYQVTYGIASGLLDALARAGAASPRRARNSIIIHYDETALARWMEEAVSAAGVVPLLGAVLRHVETEGRRLTRLHLATRHGDVEVAARGFVDASGDAVLAWLAGLDVREPEVPVFGTMMFTLEGVDEQAPTGTREQIHQRLREKGADYGLARQDGFLFSFPGRDLCLVNMTHLPTPLDPVAMSMAVLEGRAQVDRLVAFLREQFPERLGRARVRSYGLPGVRQTRWIVGMHSLGADEVREGRRFPDAVARCTWPIEGHQEESRSHWEVFGDEHVHYVPLSSMVPPGADNLVAAGRCIDGDVGALSSVRVMGPCIAMGAAAAHALDLAGAGSVHQIDVAALRSRIADNLDRRDPAPSPAG